MPGLYNHLCGTLSNLYYCPDCGGEHHAPNLKDQNIFTDAELDGFIKGVWDGAYKNGKVDNARVNKYAKEFGKAIKQGYGEVKQVTDFKTKDKKMIKALSESAFHFSGAKNKAEIISLSQAIYTKKGGIRTFASFQREAAKILGEFQGNWLRTEYDMAVNVSTMAARWAEYEDTDILVYRTAGDGRVRPEHDQLNGIAKRKTDPFWNTFYPPNGWKCRCHTETSGRQRGTSNSRIPAGAYDNIPGMFRNNFAKKGWLFPADHPYFKTAKEDKK